MKKRYFYLFLLILLFTACRADSDTDQAERALIRFFDLLSNEAYPAAAELYGGSYETLQAFNPDLDPNNHEALWRNGCQVNGLQCRPVYSVTLIEHKPPGEYVFIVEFTDSEGNRLVIEGCCGETVSPPISRFEYRVVNLGDQQYRILDPPVYVP